MRPFFVGCASRSLLVAVGLLAGCPSGRAVKMKRPSEVPALATPSVVTLTESRPVSALAADRHRVYVGTPDGLWVWYLKRRTFEEWGPGHGLPSPEIHALATDDRRGVWMLSDAGLHLFNEDHFVSFENQPPELGRARYIVASSDGRTAWIGGLGVLRVRDGLFQSFLPGAKVTALTRDADGKGVWVGTAREGAYRFTVDRFLRFGSDWGLHLTEIDAIALTKRGDPVVSGKGPDGESLAYFDGKRFWEYWVSAAEVRVLGRTKGGLRVAANRRVWALKIGGEPRGNGPRIVPTENGAPVLWLLETPGRAPHDVTATVATDEDVFFGTKAVGVLRAEGEALRTRDVRGDRDRLGVGCDQTACYFAGGGGRFFRLRHGALSFEPGDIGSDRLLWVTNHPNGEVVALLAARDRSAAQLTVYDNGQFVPREGREVSVPSGEPLVNYAEYSPSGDLWVSLSFTDESGEPQNYGVAVIYSNGEVTYHEASKDEKDRTKDGSLPIPHTIRGAAFGPGSTWLATHGGLIRIQEGSAARVSRDDAPIGDICSDVAVGKDGVLWAASPDGVARFRNDEWNTLAKDGPLERGASALEFDKDGTMFVGTPGGVYRWKGSSVERIEGTIGDIVLDMEIDNRGRLWVLTTDGYTVYPH